LTTKSKNALVMEHIF